MDATRPRRDPRGPGDTSAAPPRAGDDAAALARLLDWAEREARGRGLPATAARLAEAARTLEAERRNPRLRPPA